MSNTFAYDQANRMTQSVVGGSPSITATYGYDGDGLRIAKTIGSTTTRYVWDTAAGLPTLLDDGTRKYVWGADGLAYNVRGSGTAEQVEVYHTDHLGSTRALSVGDGSLSTIYLTDEWGVPNAPEAPSGQTPSTQPFWFTGELLDRDTGTNLVYLRARHYDPGTGRFTSRDPWAGSIASPMTLNRYAYAANNPTNFVDPSGRCVEPVSGTVCLVVAGGVILVGGAVIATSTFVEQNPELVDALADAVDESFDRVETRLRGLGGQVQRSAESLGTWLLAKKQGEQRPGGEPSMGDLKRVPDAWIDALGGENWTRVVKKRSGGSRSDLYYDPDTGQIYAVRKGSRVAVEIDETVPDHLR